MTSMHKTKKESSHRGLTPIRLEQFRVHIEASLQDAMERLEGNTMGFLVVIDDSCKVSGVLTNGDVRRALLKGYGVKDSVAIAYSASAYSVDTSACMATVANLFKKPGVHFLPVTNPDGVLVNIITRGQFNAFLLEAGEFSTTYNFLKLDPTEEEQQLDARPWGFYKTVFLNQHTRAKILCVNPSQALSLQYHCSREEHWVVVSGLGEVTLGSSIRQVTPGDYIFIPQEVQHRLRNTSGNDMLMITEVQLGHAFDEEDIVRIDDLYKR